MKFIKLTATPYQKRSLGTKTLWINVEDISCMAEYETHTAVHTRSGVYGVREKPKEILDMLDVIGEQPTIPQWILVSERLPKEYEWVLITFVGIDGEHHIDYAFNSYNSWHSELMHFVDVKVIAWMPLPEPYKESDK